MKDLLARIRDGLIGANGDLIKATGRERANLELLETLVDRVEVLEAKVLQHDGEIAELISPGGEDD